MNELKEAGKKGIVSLNVTKPKRPKAERKKKQVVSETPQPIQEKKILSTTLLEGTVKWYSATRGYGFLTCDGKDYFCHHTNIVGDISEGDKVTFDTKQTEKGLSAIKVIKQEHKTK